ncbi:BPSS1780 family membrane protein [Lysobacter firmicutimachus]|uniref:BPSS1780 family membrane protein n=1 Tax=Lysobacter firmicutimachus TaxID=1792846 RepID=A0ABU8CXM3_9GAMM
MTQPIRKVPLSHGVQWLLRAVNLGARNPRAIFGAAVLFMAVLYLLAVLLATPARSLAGSADPDMSGIATALIPMFVLLVLALPVLLAGLMHVIREAEAGRPTRARDLFAPLRQHKLSALAGVGLIQIALTLISGALVVWLAGQDYWSQYLEMLRDALSGRVATPPEPEHPGLMMLVQLLSNYFTNAILLIAVPLIMFSGLGLSEAVKRSLGASLWNLGAYLLAAMLFMAAVMISGLIVALVAMVATQIGSLLHPAVGSLLAMVLLIAYGATVLVVLCGTCYFAWRDVFGHEADAAAAAASTPRPGQFEA